ncbi:MAG: hypothetical protein J7M38_09840 [Armatimonadetes bacterium]|nr:hypothetical protein [Armatimonadota bacterium]
MRRIFGIIVGLLLFFPGATFVQWLSEELGLYHDMTLTDALLVILIVVGCAMLFGQPHAKLSADEIEEQARRMELASQRLEAAQRRLRSARRTVRQSPEQRGVRTRGRRTRI